MIKLITNALGENLRVLDGSAMPVLSRRGATDIGLELVTLYTSTTPLAGGKNRTVVGLDACAATALLLELANRLGASIELKPINKALPKAEKARGEEYRPPCPEAYYGQLRGRE